GVSIPCSLFDLLHPLNGELPAVGSSGVTRYLGQRLVAADRHDLVRCESSFGSNAAERFSQSMRREALRQACELTPIAELIGEAGLAESLTVFSDDKGRRNPPTLHVIEHGLPRRQDGNVHDLASLPLRDRHDAVLDVLTDYYLGGIAEGSETI